DSLVREQRERLDRNVLTAPVSPGDPGTIPVAPKVPDPPPLESSWVSRVELALLGGIREDSNSFQRRLTYSPRPTYPVTARKGGVEGRVRLQVRLTQDGKAQIEKVVEGSEPSLVEGAIDSIKTWRGKAAYMNGRKVDVISTVTVEFHLR